MALAAILKLLDLCTMITRHAMLVKIKKEHKQETGIKTQIIQTCVLLSTLSEGREGEAGCVFALLNSEHSQERVQHGNATWSLRSITTYRHTLTHAHEERETRITQKKYF